VCFSENASAPKTPPTPTITTPATRLATDGANVYAGLSCSSSPEILFDPKPGSGPPKTWGIAVDGHGVYWTNSGDGTVMIAPR
jgi:hypothetical protein